MDSKLWKIIRRKAKNYQNLIKVACRGNYWQKEEWYN